MLWLRYIDDVICFWLGPLSEFEEFMKYLNSSHPTIKFTHEISSHSVDFLDLTLYKGQRYKTTHLLDIKPYFKPTNKFQYLEYTSAHPKGIFTSLVKGELTRLLRASSSKETYLNQICKAFRERGYPNQLSLNRFPLIAEITSSKIKKI